MGKRVGNYWAKSTHGPGNPAPGASPLGRGAHGDRGRERTGKSIRTIRSLKNAPRRGGSTVVFLDATQPDTSQPPDQPAPIPGRVEITGDRSEAEWLAWFGRQGRDPLLTQVALVRESDANVLATWDPDGAAYAEVVFMADYHPAGVTN